MRNLKKLLAVIVAIVTLVTFTIPAFAADTATTTAAPAAPAAKTEAQICTDLGVIVGSGSGVTADYLGTQPDRLQGAIMFLRLKGLESAAKAFTGTDNFADVAGLNETNQAILAYLKANPDLGFGGVGDNKFSATTKMSAKEYYKVLLVALGYTYGTDATADFTWSSVFSFAASKGLTKLIDNEKFTVNDLAVGTVEALKTAVKGGTDTLIATLVENSSVTADKATASGLYKVVAKAFEVESATTDNLKTAQIVFNQEVDSTTVNPTNISSAGVDNVYLKDDDKTAVVTFTSRKDQSGTADIVISGVKSAAGTTIDTVTKKVTFVDTTIPTVTGATAKNAKTIRIAVNEPLNINYAVTSIMSEVKIDGAAAIAKTSFDYTKNELELNLFTALTAGSHKIDISGLKDFANYTAVATSFNFDVVEDKVAPTVSSATVKNQNEIEVTFSEDLATLGSFTVNGTPVAKAEKSSTNNAVVTLTLGASLNIAATVEYKIVYVDQTDAVGNKTASSTYTGKTADDTAIPTVTAAISARNVITLTFSKTMANNVGTIDVYTGTTPNKIYTVAVTESSFKVNTNRTVIELPTTPGLTQIPATPIKVTIKNMTDGTIRNNPLAETNLSLNGLDTKDPVIYANYTVKNSDSGPAYDTATFYFSETMDPTTLNSLTNYVMTTDSAISLATYSGAKVSSVSADGRSVTVVVPGIADRPATTFSLYTMKDIAGNAVNATGITKLAATPLTLVSATATAIDTVDLTFSTDVYAFGPSDFFATKTSTGSAGDSFIIGYTISGTKVTVKLNSSIGTDPNGRYWIGNMTNAATTDIYGTPVTTAAPMTIVDAVKPTATAAATTAGITVTMSETVTVPTTADLRAALIVRKVSDGSYVTLTDANIAYVDMNGSNFKTFNVTGLDPTTSYTIEVLPTNIVDLYGNKVSAMAAATITTK